MTDSPAPPLVQTPEGLEAVIAALSSASTVALDTEFHAERRYRPDLKLLQLGARGGPVYTIDPLAVDLAPLGPVLDQKCWLAHGAHWDIVLVNQATGARPSALLDTQILAGMAGLDFPARLDTLTQRILGQTLDKGSTLSNWNQRPLDPEQLAYARADVRLLCPLAAALEAQVEALDEKISARQGLAWSRAAGLEAVAAALAPPDPDRQWRDLDIAPGLDAPTRRALHALFRWREEEAKRRNSPPHYILAPSIALDLARRRPETEAGLRANRRIPAGLLKRHRHHLLEVIQQAASQPDPPPVPDVQRGGLLAFFTAWTGLWANALAVAPKLLAPSNTLRSLAADPLAGLQGWRSDALSEGLGRVMRGELALGIDKSGQLAGLPT